MPTVSRNSKRSMSILRQSMNDDDDSSAIANILNNNLSGRKVVHDKISTRNSSLSNSKKNYNPKP
jgi:hypothetical protein